jgi:hypothetical protein
MVCVGTLLEGVASVEPSQARLLTDDYWCHFLLFLLGHVRCNKTKEKIGKDTKHETEEDLAQVEGNGSFQLDTRLP